MNSPHTRRSGRRRRAPVSAWHAAVFIFGAAVSAFGLVAVYWFFVRTRLGQFLDESALDEASSASRRVAGSAASFLDYLPVISVVVAAVVVLVVCLVRGRWTSAGIAVGAMAAANLTTQILKNFVFDRPDRGIETLHFNSLPSGHTTLAASSAAAIFLMVSPKWRPLVATVGGAYSAIAGVSTLTNAWHRPADVIAAYLVVTFWTLIGGLIILHTGPRWNVWRGYNRHWGSWSFWPGVCVFVGALAAAAAVLFTFIGGVPDTPVVPQSPPTPHYYWAGLAMIVATAALLAALTIWVFGRAARIRHR